MSNKSQTVNSIQINLLVCTPATSALSSLSLSLSHTHTQRHTLSKERKNVTWFHYLKPWNGGNWNMLLSLAEHVSLSHYIFHDNYWYVQSWKPSRCQTNLKAKVRISTQLVTDAGVQVQLLFKTWFLTYSTRDFPEVIVSCLLDYSQFPPIVHLYTVSVNT